MSQVLPAFLFVPLCVDHWSGWQRVVFHQGQGHYSFSLAPMSPSHRTPELKKRLTLSSSVFLCRKLLSPLPSDIRLYLSLCPPPSLSLHSVPFSLFLTSSHRTQTDSINPTHDLSLTLTSRGSQIKEQDTHLFFSLSFVFL